MKHDTTSQCAYRPMLRSVRPVRHISEGGGYQWEQQKHGSKEVWPCVLVTDTVTLHLSLFFRKLNIYLPYDLPITLISSCPRWKKTGLHPLLDKNVHSDFVNDGSKQAKCLDKQIGLYLYNEYYCIKKGKIHSFEQHGRASDTSWGKETLCKGLYPVWFHLSRIPQMKILSADRKQVIGWL